MIIIGTGAGGGTLAHHLAPSGKRILLLERGDWLPREPQNWLAHDVFVDNRYVSEDTWYDDDGKPFQPQIHYFVGGATKLYGAALYRLREKDFGELQHHDGISPAWPISYDELEPYYTKAEQLYQVHGSAWRGSDRAACERALPVPGRLARAAHPAALRRSGRRRLPARSTRRAGSCSTSRTRPTARCVRCATCDGFPCLVHAKSDAEVIAVRPALEHPNVTLLDEREGGQAARRTPAEPLSPRWSSSAKARTERYAADIVVVGVRRSEHGQAPASLGERQASRTA